ncbi:hypothetical protein GCM10009414_00600 [Tatumella terrea]|uniref:Flagellar FliJ protein n=1 Tax=Tatumella terrea TaxID=419007 RepID=A0ABW1W2H0_9GAMM|nr:flagellar FliJ family protein [Tatumella sp. JGM118]MBS0909890.1 flagellar FliJ family protein [Tatumella sp. JGM118]
MSLTDPLKTLERLRRQQLQQCQQRVNEQQAMLRGMQSKIHTLQSFLQSPMTPVTQGLALRNQDNYARELRHLLRWQQQQHLAAEQELARRQTALLESHLQYKRLESYGHELARSELQQQRRQEQKSTDALAALRFARKS